MHLRPALPLRYVWSVLLCGLLLTGCQGRTYVSTVAPQPTITPDPLIAYVRVGEGPCVGVEAPPDTPPGDSSQRWDAPPPMQIDITHTYCAILTTEKGRMVLQLYPRIAPNHVNNFVFLARQGFYDNLTFHRVIPGFMVQTGDPDGANTGGPGYQIPLEVHPTARYDRAGVVGMARAQRDTAGSQFFITYAEQPSLNPGLSGPGYTIFGQLVEGQNVLRTLKPRNPDDKPAYTGDRLITVRIVDLGVVDGTGQ